MENTEYSLKKTARLAGLLYLIWIVTGLYSIFYIPSKIDTRGDAATAAQNILSNEFLFRTSIMNGLISSTLWIFLVLVLYRLFKPVNERQAKLMVAFVIVQIPIAFITEAFSITSLMILKGEVLKTFELIQRQDLAMLFLKINEIPIAFITEAFSITSLMILKGEVLKTFELIQRQDLAMLFLKINDYIVSTLVLFWGLWLFPLAILVYRSGFLPRFLGVWLILNGFAFLVLSFTGLLLPQYKDMVYNIAMPAMFGEVAFTLWLLIRGAKDNIPAIDRQ